MKRIVKLLIALTMILLISCQEKKEEKISEIPPVEVAPEQSVVETAPPLPEESPSSSSDVQKEEDVPAADIQQKSAHSETIVDMGSQKEADQEKEEEKTTEIQPVEAAPEQPVVEAVPSSSSDVQKEEDVPAADIQQKSAHPEAIIDMGSQKEADDAIEEARKTAEKILDETKEAASQAAEQLMEQAAEGQSLMEQAQQNRPPGLEKFLTSP